MQLENRKPQLKLFSKDGQPLQEAEKSQTETPQQISQSHIDSVSPGIAVQAQYEDSAVCASGVTDTAAEVSPAEQVNGQGATVIQVQDGNPDIMKNQSEDPQQQQQQQGSFDMTQYENTHQVVETDSYIYLVPSEWCAAGKQQS